MKLKTKLLIFAAIFAIFDLLIPIPFSAFLLLYILLEKPLWFKKMVDEIYKNE